jgi:hypothetical protein
MVTKTLSLEIPEPLKNGQCNILCRFFWENTDDAGYFRRFDRCRAMFGKLKYVKLDPPSNNKNTIPEYAEKLFPANECPWAISDKKT